LDKLSREIDELEERVKDENVVFCHNDLLSLNIIYDKNTDSISFIDYEYCGYNYQAFDIGNHFCEYAGFELNIDAYPNEQQQKKFISAYLEEYNKSKPTEQEIENMYQKADTFAQLANIFWSVWAIQQAHFSEIEFDYLEYCIKRLDWYRSQANASKK
jgi:ethanolamine kinase